MLRYLIHCPISVFMVFISLFIIGIVTYIVIP